MLESTPQGGPGGLSSAFYPTTNFPWNLRQMAPLKPTALSAVRLLIITIAVIYEMFTDIISLNSFNGPMT